MVQHIPQIERVSEATNQLAKEIGVLMPDLLDRLPSGSVNLNLLTSIIDSPERELIIARLHGRLVGSAVLNLIIFTSGKKAWLEDFVVTAEKSIRGTGVGFALWQEIVEWACEREAPLEFTSAPSRIQAHEFYNRQGALIKPTSVFRYET